MPPRGPPKGNVDGPNRGVSKLQLLRCGNDYIRRLKGRVERRDEEIEKLRKEIGRLRLANGGKDVEGAMAGGEDVEELDLEKDLDAIEYVGGGIFGRSQMSKVMEGEEEGEDGE